MFAPSTKTRYGFELMTALAKQYNKKNLSLSSISKDRGLPVKYLEQIASMLKEAKLIESKMGRLGGYFLLKPPEKITLNQILEALKEPVKSGTCDGCPSVSLCGGQKEVWGEVGNSVRQTMNETTLKDLI
ncbi:RrF2 family transcriptional regulator [Patescibacteria group bacterium]